MKTLISTLVLGFALTGAAMAATAVNKDKEPTTLVVTEGGKQVELSLGPGETTDFCTGGCFVTLPNGDREALSGTETIEIEGGRARVK